MNRHKSGFFTALLLAGAVAILISCAGCGQTTAYGAYSDSERGVCASEGLGSTTSYNRHGPVTRCALPE
jgi:hypothetical protein